MNIGIIGLGTVSQGFIEILMNKTEWLNKEYGKDIKIVAVKDIQKGNMYRPEGIDPAALLHELRTGEKLTDPVLKDDDSISSLPIVDLVVEATYSDYISGDPAYTYIKDTLTNGKHVITTNKGPVALRFSELDKIAKSNNVTLAYEGTVLSGTPVFSLIDSCLAGNDVVEIRGILNGTSNYILSHMAEGASFEDVLQVAKSKGYAEADPTNDVKGFDARGKVAILAHKVFGVDLGLENISTEGIDGISKEELETAKNEHKSIRLVGTLKKDGETVYGKVQPEFLNGSDALASIDGVTNALEITTKYLDKILITGPGAGKLETGYAVFSDLLSIIKKR